MVKFIRIILIGLFFGLQACPPAREAKGRLLFTTNKNPQQLANEKSAFLNQPILQQTGRPRYFLGVTPRADNNPRSPILHTYQNVGGTAPLEVAFPEAFRWNIPKAIRDVISKSSATRLDILFVPQLGVFDQACLKPENWLHDVRLDTVNGSPPELHQHVQMAVFEPDYPIGNQIKEGDLHTFSSHLHDGLVSPDTGYLSFTNAPTPNRRTVAFWSLVIANQGDRAVVTLHWNLEPATDLEKLRTDLATNQAAHGTLNGLMNLLEAPSAAPLAGAPATFDNPGLMRKLRALTRP